MELTIFTKKDDETLTTRLVYDVTLNQMISETLPIFLSYLKQKKCNYHIYSEELVVTIYSGYVLERDDLYQLKNALSYIERPLYNFLPQFSAVDFHDKMFAKLNSGKYENTEPVPVCQ